MGSNKYHGQSITAPTTADHLNYWLSRHWLLLLGIPITLFVALPWLAPVLMKGGYDGAARTIYLLYATQCHQLPQRSFFLFGGKPMYSLAEIQAAWQVTNNPLILRQFVGNAAMGWKVAWSDRMSAMYTSLLFFGLLYGLFRQRIRPLPLWAFALFLLPMFLDGSTHAISDMLAGIGSGFRDTNTWLAWLTNHILPTAFYSGDGLGSFNSWMRLVSGLFFGMGVIWFVCPRLERAFDDSARQMEVNVPGD